MFFEKRLMHSHLQKVHDSVNSSLFDLDRRMEGHQNSVVSWLQQVYRVLREQESKNRKYDEELRVQRAIIRKNSDVVLEVKKVLEERSSHENSLRRVQELVTALTHRILNLEKSIANLSKKDENVEVLMDSVSLLRSRLDRVQREAEEHSLRAVRSVEQKVSVLSESLKSLDREELKADLSRSFKSELELFKSQLVDPRVRAIEERLESLKSVDFKPVIQPVVSPQPQSTFLREKLLKKLSRKSKDYIKTVLLSLIAKYGRISGLELREIIVEEQSLCSKSSFYRLLEELEHESDIGVLVEGKEKIFLAKRAKLPSDL